MATGSWQLSRQYMDEMLGKSLGLMKGGGTPQELPWFKGFQDQINKATTTQTSQVLRDAMSRGIRGGTLEELLKAPAQAGTEGILKSILSIYQQNPQQTMPFINTALQRQGQVEQLDFMKKQARQQEHDTTLGRIMQMFGMGAGAAQGGLSMLQSNEQMKELMKILGPLLLAL